MTAPKVISEREDEILLFDALPGSITDGTSYDYYTKYPMFDEEQYYILECATRNNADPDRLVAMCRDIQQERNRMLIEMFENKPTNPYDIEIDDDK